MTEQIQLTLYSFRRCPYAMRARMALSYAKLSYTLREVDLKNKPEALLTASPKGTVPVLIVNETQIIDESLDVVGWVSQQTNQPLDFDVNKHVWVEKLHQKFIPTMHRYKYPERYPEVDQADNLKLVNDFLTSLDGWLETQQKDMNPWVEIALFPLIRQLWIIDDGWTHADIPNVTNWVKAISQSDEFMRVMEKHAVWQSEATEPVIIKF